MATPFISDITMFAGNFAPVGWMFCDGRLLPIDQYSPLFALIGTTYGGDGVTTFALPDLRGRFPIHQGQGPGLSNYVQGQMAGSESVTLVSSQIPSHSHALFASDTNATTASANGNLPAKPVQADNSTSVPGYAAPGTGMVQMNAAAISGGGGNQPHDNMQPYLAVNFIIAVQGVFPSRN